MYVGIKRFDRSTLLDITGYLLHYRAGIICANLNFFKRRSERNTVASRLFRFIQHVRMGNVCTYPRVSDIRVVL